MTNDITPLLLYSKNQFLLATKDIVYPYLVNTMQTMYNECLSDDSADDILRFQMALKQVPAWNSQVIEFKTNEILNKFPHFEDLLTALIVANVKVMSSINLSQQRPSVSLKIPDVNDIVHQMYIMMSFSVYNNVQNNMYFMDEEFRMVSDSLVENAIESAIRRLIPMKDILGCFLSGDQAAASAAADDEDEDDEEDEEEEVEEDDDDGDGDDDTPDELTVQQHTTDQPTPAQFAPAPILSQPPSYPAPYPAPSQQEQHQEQHEETPSPPQEETSVAPQQRYPAPPLFPGGEGLRPGL